MSEKKETTKKQNSPETFCKGVLNQYKKHMKNGFKMGNTSMRSGAWQRCKQSFPKGITEKVKGGSRRRSTTRKRRG